MSKLTIVAAALMLALGCVKQQAQQAQALRPQVQPLQAKAAPADSGTSRDALIDKAWKYLLTQYNVQGKPENKGVDSGWGPKSMNIAYTALVLQGIHGTKQWDETNANIRESLEFVLDSQEATGGFSLMPEKIAPAMKGQRAVYITGIVAALMAELNKAGFWKGKLDQKIALARDYLKQAQVGNPEGPAKDYSKGSVGYGGWAYSKEELPKKLEEKKPAANMSTTIYAMDALKACGVAADDPLWQDALIFLKRNHNAGEMQDESFVAKTQDGKTVKMAGPDSPDFGGSIYSEDSSMVDERTENEDGTVTLHSYGTMTYNLLRAYLFAGLKKDSLPIKLAMGWVKKNYVLSKVPGYRKEKQFDQGLFYYYVSFARTLNALGEDTIEDDRGFKHDWRAELIEQLAKVQKDDGSWINANPKWQENSPVLATAFALDALRNTRK